MPTDHPPLAPVCTRCGYNLTGLPTVGRCPECGYEYDSAHPPQFAERPPWGAGALLIPPAIIFFGVPIALASGFAVSFVLFVVASVWLLAVCKLTHWYALWHYSERVQQRIYSGAPRERKRFLIIWTILLFLLELPLSVFGLLAGEIFATALIEVGILPPPGLL